MQLLGRKSQMPKNIVLISDGTAQVGGNNFDEALTKVYKLYRAAGSASAANDAANRNGGSRGPVTVHL
jgi:hypothetical protein